ncbi:MAG TPA: glutathione S-transferase N-terminal domain-containing protein [Solirubrobacterales bacterium]
MLVLYDNPVSGNCHKVRLILGMLGIQYERRELSVIDHSDRLEVLGGLSPTLNVPTVVLDDGRPLAESNAILWYFADGTEYLPEDRASTSSRCRRCAPGWRGSKPTRGSCRWIPSAIASGRAERCIPR